MLKIPAIFRSEANCLPLVILIFLLIWCGWMIGHTIFNSLHDYGDSGAEAALLMGVRNFFRYGFVKTHFLPIHNSGPTIPFDLIVQWTYDRYPPGPDLIASVVGRFTPEGVFWPYRLLPTILNLTAIYLFFRIASAVLGNGWPALFGAIAYAMNFVFMQLADSFYYSGYAEFLRMFIIWAVYRQVCFAKTPAAMRSWQMIVVIASFVNVWITFDYISTSLLTSFLLVALLVQEDRGLTRRLWRAFIVVLPIGLATAFAMLARLIQNSWARGSTWEAVHNFYLTLMYRVFNQTPGVEWYSKPVDLGNVVRSIIDSTAIAFGLNWTIVLVSSGLLAVLILLGIRQPLVRRYCLFLLMIAPGNFVYIMMLPAWAEEHYNTFGIRHILPTYALIVGGGLYMALFMTIGAPGRELMRAAASATKGALRDQTFVPTAALLVSRSLFTLAACGVICYAFGSILLWNFNGTLHLWRTSAEESWAGRFTHMDVLRQRMVPNSMVFGNAHWFRPEARYRFDLLTHGTWGLQELHDEPFWLPPPGTGDLIPFLPVGAYEGYFVFYQRWGDPNDRFIPNFGPSETDLEARTRKLQSWLQVNAEFIVSSGKWSLYRLTRLPSAAEVKADLISAPKATSDQKP